LRPFPAHDMHCILVRWCNVPFSSLPGRGFRALAPSLALAPRRLTKVLGAQEQAARLCGSLSHVQAGSLFGSYFQLVPPLPCALALTSQLLAASSSPSFSPPILAASIVTLHLSLSPPLSQLLPALPCLRRLLWPLPAAAVLLTHFTFHRSFYALLYC